jgi:hypothetical protein
MRTWIRVSLSICILTGIIVGKWWYDHPDYVAGQWACHRIAAAASLEDAKVELEWFEPDEEEGDEEVQKSVRDARLRILVENWGTGDPQFDLTLAQYVSDPTSSESLREAFSRYISRRRILQERWAHYWCYRSVLEPDEEIDSVIAYFDSLESTDSNSEGMVTWRQILNLQAVLYLYDKEQIDRELSPNNWRVPYRQWQRTRTPELPSIQRPTTPFPE